MLTEISDNYSYGIVIDAGSSGSRLHIFKWPNPRNIDKNGSSHEVLASVPKIEQAKDWVFKSNPGLSNYEHNPEKAFSKHIRPLLSQAEKVIPYSMISKTPIFVQATAGMRLLPRKRRDEILKEICKGIKKSTNFLMQDCETQVQIIDGETEGLYGWLGLNYLLGHFNNFDANEKDHFSMGFMDMGGASAQIAFVPSDEDEVKRHREDIPTVYLKSINGDVQEWNVYVSTWLGFGANQARKRYLAQLVNALPENTNNYDDDDFTTRKISDPCMPKGCKTEFEFKDKEFEVIGIGSFEQCSKSIYPLLLKNIPCDDEPCLFNGVHTPKIDFSRDKFVGISEYWYTPNDVFNLGGDYSYEIFNSNVREFCNSDWDNIEENRKNGKYNSIPEEFLKDSCFKSNWILNVLHEGFQLPQQKDQIASVSKDSNGHPMFQSLEKVLDTDLSWTLGRILLYASGMVSVGREDIKVGIVPSAMEAKKFDKTFIPGLIEANNMTEKVHGSISRYFLLFIILVLLAYLVLVKKLMIIQVPLAKLHKFTNTVRYQILKFRTSSVANFFEPLSDLEAGESGNNHPSDKRDAALMLKSKSMFNLNTSRPDNNNSMMQTNLFSETERINRSRPLSQGLQSSQSSANIRPAFSMADFSKFQKP